MLLVQSWPGGATAVYADRLLRALRRDPTGPQSSGPAVNEQRLAVKMLAPRSYSYATQEGAVLPYLVELRGTGLSVRAFNAGALFVRRLIQMSQVRSLMDAVHPAVVHVLGASGVGPAMLLACRRRRIPLVVTIHDLPPRTSLWNPAKAIASGGPGFLLADHIIVHGQWSKAELVRRFGERAGRRTSALDLGAFDYGAPSAERHVLRAQYGLPNEQAIALFFGSLRADKGLETALRALATVSAVTLFVVGHEPSRSEPPASGYRELANRLGISERVVWKIGWLPDTEVADVFRSSDFVVLPYARTFSGQSAVVRVAQQYGVPAVGSERGEVGAALAAMPDSIAVDGESLPAVAEGIRQMAARVAGRGPVSSGANPSEFAWDAIATSVLSIYRRLLAPEG